MAILRRVVIILVAQIVISLAFLIALSEVILLVKSPTLKWAVAVLIGFGWLLSLVIFRIYFEKLINCGRDEGVLLESTESSVIGQARMRSVEDIMNEQRNPRREQLAFSKILERDMPPSYVPPPNYEDLEREFHL